jgi:rhodanese-related sulfurtransferase
MRSMWMASVLALGLGLSACGGEEEAAAIPEVSVAQVTEMLEDGAVPVDANGEDTRNERGTLPGARLLTSSGRYDPAAELPSDKATQLVFYCGGEQCHASDTAAERARDAGYENVSVMRAGIAGWVEAGRPVDRPGQS